MRKYQCNPGGIIDYICFLWYKDHLEHKVIFLQFLVIDDVRRCVAFIIRGVSVE